jgi:tetratricopeptide (TPR) repeat protein
MKHFRLLFLNILVIALLCGCGSSKIKEQFNLIQSGKITVKGIGITYLNDSTILPPEFPAPNFQWIDTLAQSTNWSVFITNNSGKVLIKGKSDKGSWQPDSTEWESIKKYRQKGNYTFTVINEKPSNDRYSSGKITFTFSNDSVGAEIFFRAVTLPFSYAVKNVQSIEWYLGNVKGDKPRKMLDKLPVCGNCHSFSKGSPMLAMDVDYGNDKGSYAIAAAKDTCFLKPENIISWSYYKKEERNPTFGLLSQIAPNGEYVLSTIKDLSVFVAVDNNLAYSQLFFPIKGVIGIYDIKNKVFSDLPGADNPKYVQSNPSWSPDSKKVIFARTEAYVSERVRNAGRALLHLDDIKEFSSGEKEFKYSLYSIDFNNGKGGKAEPIEGASFNGKSNYFPKYSPNGKWVVFCQAENFMLLQPDSRLYIMPSGGGKPRLMRCNMNSMNSWHSFSPNGRWMVFSSKSRGLYTQLYLTHIDENGMDSPPVLLENLKFEKRACNIPEFFPGDADKFFAIKDAFSNTAPYYLQMATDNMDNKYFKRTWDNISKSISLDSSYLEAYFQRIILNGILKQSNSQVDRQDKYKARKLVDSLLVLHSNDEKLLLLNATLYSISGNTDLALKEANNVLKINPENFKAYELICSIYRKTNQKDKILPVYHKMRSLFPSKKDQLNNLIAAYYEENEQYNEALPLLNNLIADNPIDLNIRASRAGIYLKTKRFELAKKDLDYVITQKTLNYKCNQLMYNYYNSINKPIDANEEIYIVLDLIEKQINSNNENIELLFEKANILSNMKRWRDADDVYSKILGIFPYNYEALKEKARIKLTEKIWNDAIYYYNQLEKYYVPEEEFFNNKAIAYINLGNYDQALLQLNKTIEINPDNFDAKYNRIRLYNLLGNKTQAEIELLNLKTVLQKKQKSGKASDSEKELLLIITKKS